VTCGLKGPSSSSIVSIASRSSAARSPAGIRSREAVSKVYSAFTSSMMALIAVLKWKSRSMSPVTRVIVSCTVRRNAWPSGVVTTPTVAPARTSSACCRTKRHTRLRKRLAPSTPWSFQSRSFSGGAAKSENSRAVSAPKVRMRSSGSTTLPFDLDIFAPSLMTIPCESRAWNGSSTFTRPMSRRTLV